jgi:putative ABC transport system permease protein
MTRLRQLTNESLRRDRRRNVFVILAVALLGVGSGASLLVASLYDQLVLRRLPVAHPEQLAIARKTNLTGGRETDYSGNFSLEECSALERGTRAKIEIACFESSAAVVGFDSGTERVTAEWVTPNYFDVLGLRPESGRLFARDADQGTQSIVLSSAAWQRRFGGSESTIGRVLTVEGKRSTIVGIAPRGFHSFALGTGPEFFGLAEAAHGEAYRTGIRILAGINRAQAQTLLRQVEAEYLRTQPKRLSFTMVDGKMTPSQERLDVLAAERGDLDHSTTLARILLLAGGLVAGVLLILCVNLANLLAARAADQRRQAAIRRALGASSWGLAAAWIRESLMIGLLGTGLGLLLAQWTGPRLLAALPELQLGAEAAFAIDGRIAMAALALSVLTAMVVGGVAAWEAARVPLAVLLSSDGRSTSRGASWRWSLVAIQVGLSLVLLVVMGLLASSLGGLLAIDTGLPLDRILTVRADLPASETRNPQEVWRALQSEARGLPGVTSVSYAKEQVLGGMQFFRSASIEGYTSPTGEPQMIDTVDVSPGFFETLGIAPRDGRAFTALDARGKATTALVNQRFVARYLPHSQPVGKHLSAALDRGDWSHQQEGDLEIIGVVEDRQLGDVREHSFPRAYLLAEPDTRMVVFYLRSTVPAETLANGLRTLIQRRAPEVALGEIRTLRGQLDHLLGRERIVSYLAEAMGLVGMLIAALGLYGVTRLTVGHQLREIALRIALGANARRVAGFVLHDALRAVGVGLLAGTACAAPAGKLMASFLYGIGPENPHVFAGALVGLVVVAFVACAAPVFMALHTDPAVVLKHE